MAILTAKQHQIEASKLMIACRAPYNCMVMSEAERDNILSSAPARFQLLTAYHPGITGRLLQNFGRKLSTSFRRNLIDIILKLEVVIAHLEFFYCDDAMVLGKTAEMLKFCRSLSNIYQVCSFFLLILSHIFPYCFVGLFLCPLFVFFVVL